MCTPSFRWLAVPVAMGLASPPVSAQVPPRLTGEIGLAYLTVGGDLGHTRPISPEGYLTLRGAEAAPALEVAVVLPSPLLGIRPFARVAHARAATIPAAWTPCDPGLACPSILIEPTVRASRSYAAMGLEVPLLSLVSGVGLDAVVGVGVRRYGFSWESWGGPPDNSFHLPEGSHAEWDRMAQLGVGLRVPVGAVALSGRWTALVSDFGAGVVPRADGSGTVDLGRSRTLQNVLHLAVRRPML